MKLFVCELTKDVIIFANDENEAVDCLIVALNNQQDNTSNMRENISKKMKIAGNMSPKIIHGKFHENDFSIESEENAESN